MLKEKIIHIIKDMKIIHSNNKKFDAIKDEISSYGDNFLENVWNILNEFPESKCKECGEKPKFKGFKFGYRDFCGVKCSNVYKGKDEERNKRISESVSVFMKTCTKEFFDERTITYRNTIENQSEEYKLEKKIQKSDVMKNIHINRTPEEKEKIHKKISESLITSEIAKQQRHIRAKLGAQKLKEIRSLMSEEELVKFNKRFNNNGVPVHGKDEWNEYYKLVWYYTNIDLHEVENIELRGTKYGFSLDHKYSIKQAFLDGISPEIVGNNINLEIITISENSSKGAKCSITKEFLLENFKLAI